MCAYLIRGAHGVVSRKNGTRLWNKRARGSSMGTGGERRCREENLPSQSNAFFVHSLHCRVTAHSSHTSHRRVCPCVTPMCWSLATALSRLKSAMDRRVLPSTVINLAKEPLLRQKSSLTRMNLVTCVFLAAVGTAYSACLPDSKFDAETGSPCGVDPSSTSGGIFIDEIVGGCFYFH